MSTRRLVEASIAACRDKRATWEQLADRIRKEAADDRSR